MHKIKQKSRKPQKPTAAAAAPAAQSYQALREKAAAALKAIFAAPLPEGHKRLLNIVNAGAPLPRALMHPQVQNLRFGMEAAEVDVVGRLQDLDLIPSESCDFIWNANSLAFLHAHEVPPALAQCNRILKQGGNLLIALPDLQRVASHVAQGKLERTLYTSAAGPITALDMIYGYTAAIARGSKEVETKTGFVANTIATKLTRAGFGDVEVKRDGFSLHVNARKVAAPANKPQVRYVDDETNRLMRARDEIQKEPEIWIADLSALKQ